MIVEPLAERFWNDSIAAFLASWRGRDLRDSVLYETCGKVIDPLACSILVDLVKHSRVKCPIDAQITGLSRYLGSHLTMHSGPVLQHIQFGVSCDKWLVETLVPYIDSIPNVTDRFWEDLSTISRTAPTTFQENEVVQATSPGQKQFLKSGRSIHYCIVRNFILRRSDLESCSDDIGVLRSELGVEEPYEPALKILRTLFNLYCRLVTQLYKPALLKERRSGKYASICTDEPCISVVGVE